MKTKTLMAAAVASTFGLSAVAYAGSGHEVMTPLSPSESGEVIVRSDKGFSGNESVALGSTSREAGGTISGSGPAFGESGLPSGEIAGLSSSESLALDSGIYSDYYVVSWTPVMVESWEIYTIKTGDMDELAVADQSYLVMPTHELALLETSDPSTFELALVPIEEVGDSATGE